MKLVVSREITHMLYTALEKAEAMTMLLHAHARGEDDLTEDQLANVVTGVTEEATRTLRAARRPPSGPRLPPPRRTLPPARGAVH